ncbi:MAG: inositol monophosphatase family protein [Planctomycetota bacterium]
MGISEVEPRGSSRKVCAVAEGSVDIHPRFGPTCLWDTAAGTAVAREAGCKVVSLEGEPLGYDLADAIKHHGFLVYPSSIPPELIYESLQPAAD